MHRSKRIFFDQLERRFNQELRFDFHARRFARLDRPAYGTGGRADLRTGCDPDACGLSPSPDLLICETWTKPMGIAAFNVCALHLRQLDAF